MKKFTLFITLLISFYSSVFAQDEEIIINEVKSEGYEDKSYYVVESLTLKNFSFKATSGSTFFAKTIGRMANHEEKNALQKDIITVEGITSSSVVDALDHDQKNTVINYFDGLGRNAQNVLKQGGANGYDVVTPFEYDNKGRIVNSYLSHEARTSTGDYHDDIIGELLNQYSGEKPYTTITYDDSPLDRVKTLTGVGKDWSNNGKTTDLKITYNYASEVRRWKVVGNLPQSSMYYPVNSLIVKSVTSEDGIVTKQYIDPLGRVVLNRADRIYGDGPIRPVEHYDTYYVYDELGRVRFIIPPMLHLNYSPSIDDVNKWCYQYEYDKYDNVIKSKSPGSDVRPMLFIYDNYQRLVLMQDGNQWGNSQWTFFKYDDLNRAIAVGIFETSASYESLKSNIKGSSNPHRYELTNVSDVGYTLNRTFPTDVDEDDLLSISYYDTYDVLSNSGWDVNANSYSPVTAELNASVNYAVMGQATASKTKILGTAEWLHSVIYYDDDYQAIQYISDNHLNGLDRVSTQYDFEGKMINISYNHSSSNEQMSTVESFDYDHAGRLLKITHGINNQDPIVLASCSYNERGEVIEKNLYSADGGATYLQSEDYKYNIRGWLTQINDVDHLSDENDLFGMELVYNTSDKLTSVNGQNLTPKYGGNISAVLWRRNDGINNSEKQAYKFEYDELNRFSSAEYAKEGNNYTSDGGMINEQVEDYDMNGNIKRLSRNDKINSSITEIDDLTLSHNGNALIKVEDDGTEFGYNEHNVSLSSEYTYDYNGNLTSDLNNEIVSVIYNYLDLPEEIEFYNGITITYSYDAAGTVLTKEVTKGTRTLARTDYLGGVQYENGELAFISTSEGRAINKSDKFEYEYFMTDHLGNTRLTYGMLSEVNVYKATMESERSAQEVSEFVNIDEARQQMVKMGANGGFINTTPASSQIPVPKYMAALGGSFSQYVGPGLQLDVSQNEKIKISVNAYLNGSGTDNTVLPSLVAAVTNSFQILDGGETEIIYSAFESYLPVFSGQIPNNGLKAYLNYILFPADYSGTPQFGYIPVEANNAGAWQTLKLDLDIPFNGHIYIYTANESTVSSCYFDDLQVIHDKNNAGLQVTSTSDYYPFGLEIASTRYVNEGFSPNRFRYQGQYSTYDEYTQWNAFAIRGNYDSRLGTWYSQDPYGQYSSPYKGMGNNPFNGTDPDGGWFGGNVVLNAVTWAAIGGVSGGLYSLASGADSEETRRNVMAGALTFSGVFLASKVSWSNVFNKVSDAASITASNIKATLLDIGKKTLFTPKGTVTVEKAIFMGRVYPTMEEINAMQQAELFARGDGIEPVFVEYDIVELFTTGGLGKVLRAGATDVTTSIVRRELTEEVGEQAFKKVVAKGARALWKLTDEGASQIKRHSQFGKIFKSKSDGLWWAVDNAGHGGSKFKVFKEGKKGLEWISDADEFGDFIINKHKGSTGKFIPWGQLKTIK
ncbi:DUF6443 domain-containing protein [Fulvivirga ligni]|uniref:DUF6443 domain-containing protein n=1 Tax=Fulvivirga ligni TaxID=2904246 RepID=UPI001F488880|nr:DUF6443 domain-containing protein [Fulvivirga ligni]UII22646.1 DUF6443 domain-containing protein [Fulvivirga ligni]